jgi:hypothetical protein
MRPDRGIVDQNIDPAELGQRLCGQRLDLGLFADVDGDGLDPEIPGLARHSLSLLPVGASVDHHIRTFPGELQHRRTTDIASRSGYQRDLPFKLSHAPSPRNGIRISNRLCCTVFQNRAPAATLWSTRSCAAPNSLAIGVTPHPSRL